MPSAGPERVPAHRPSTAWRPGPASPGAAAGALDGLPIEWPAPASVGAFMSMRGGGVSTAPYTSLNLGQEVGDEPEAVAENRRRFAAALGAQPCWLKQVHGRSIVNAAAFVDGPAPQADASWTDESGIGCVVQAADCLPVLFAASNGRAVAAAHAGWRGLAAGVVQATLEAVAAAAGCAARDVVVWLGPCIGPDRFEVGADVFETFGGGPRFVPQVHPDGRPRWLADLAGLVRDRLGRAGVVSISGGNWCSASDTSRFYSFRRDRVTGRLAAGVCLRR